MRMRIACLAVFLVVLICVLETGARDGNKWIPFSVPVDGDVWNSGGTPGEAAEQAWNHHRKELLDREDAAKDYSLYMPEVANRYLKSSSSTNRNIYEVPIGQPSSYKQTFPNYLTKNSDPFHFCGQEASSQLWFTKWFESLFTWPNYSRGKLASDANQFMAPSSTPNLAPGPVPAPLSYGLAPASSHSPNPYYPAEPPDESGFWPNSFASLPSPKEAPEVSPSSQLVPIPPSKKQNDFLMEIIIAVVATAVVTFALVALLFLCCFKGNSNRVGPRDGQRDEGPLLHLIDLSAGSLENSSSLGNSSKKLFSFSSKKISALTNLSVKQKTGESSSLAQTPSDGLPPLKPPPGKAAPPPPNPPPPPPPGPRPPPPPKVARPPPVPPKGVAAGIQKGRGRSTSGDENEIDGDFGAPKAKLKPFFWDKVMAYPEQAMVWHEINAGSFQFNEEMIESLFGYSDADKSKNDRKKDSSSSEPTFQYIQIIDTRKAQNLSILLRALNVTTEEVVDAIQEGNELQIELLLTLLKMAPTAEEELKLRLFSGDVAQLGPAERFLKILVDIPFAFKRIESLLFMSSLQEEVSGLKESFATLEVACKKLRSSRLFLKLLEAVLKTGNRMNDGTYRGGAQAFKLDTLLKLSDVKGTDGKTTLLHFVVQEISRSEGIRAVRTQKSSRSFSSVKTEDLVSDSSPVSAEHYPSLGLQVVSGLSTELEDVKKAALIDADALTSTMSKLSGSLNKAREFMNTENMDEEGEFVRSLASFIEGAEADIKWLAEEEERIMALVKNTADYFHGNAGKNEGLRLFAIVRDFLITLDKVCKEVKDTKMKSNRKIYKKETEMVVQPSPESRQPSTEVRRHLFPAIVDRRIDSYDSSDNDDESPSP